MISSSTSKINRSFPAEYWSVSQSQDQPAWILFLDHKESHNCEYIFSQMTCMTAGAIAFLITRMHLELTLQVPNKEHWAVINLIMQHTLISVVDEMIGLKPQWRGITSNRNAQPETLEIFCTTQRVFLLVSFPESPTSKITTLSGDTLTLPCKNQSCHLALTVGYYVFCVLDISSVGNWRKMSLPFPLCMSTLVREVCSGICK